MTHTVPGVVPAPRTEKDDWLLNLTYLILCAAVLLSSFILSTTGTVNSVNLFGLSFSIDLPCLFKLTTGFNCPACGMTRSFIYLSHFDLHRAILMNRAGVLLYALCVFEVFYRGALLLFRRVPFRLVLRIFELALFSLFVAVDLFFFFGQFTSLL